MATLYTPKQSGTLKYELTLLQNFLQTIATFSDTPSAPEKNSQRFGPRDPRGALGAPQTDGFPDGPGNPTPRLAGKLQVPSHPILGALDEPNILAGRPDIGDVSVGIPCGAQFGAYWQPSVANTVGLIATVVLVPSYTPSAPFTKREWLTGLDVTVRLGTSPGGEQEQGTLYVWIDHTYRDIIPCSINGGQG